MSQYVPKEMTGRLFKNDKGANPARPDYRGDAMVNGELVEMAAWIKESQNGKKFMSISFKPKEQQQPAKQKVVEDDFQDDDIPFN